MQRFNRNSWIKEFGYVEESLKDTKPGDHYQFIRQGYYCTDKDSTPDKGDYMKYCGQDFWYFISGKETLYVDIIEPLATKAKERNEEFQKRYAQMINVFTKEFIEDFCKKDGEIDWEKLVEFNSGNKMLKSNQ